MVRFYSHNFSPSVTKWVKFNHFHYKVAVITKAKITFVVAEMIFKVDVMAS